MRAFTLSCHKEFIPRCVPPCEWNLSTVIRVVWWRPPDELYSEFRDRVSREAVLALVPFGASS
jgi:hypothetical protein